MDDGTWHYDFHTDRDAGSPGAGVPGGPAAKLSRNSALESASGVDAGRPGYKGPGENGANSERSALEGSTSSINLFEWPDKINDGAGDAALRAEITTGPLGYFVSKALDAGNIRIEAQGNFDVQAWTNPDGSIVLNPDAIKSGQAQSVLLHEAFHAGTHKLIGTAAWNNLIGELRQISRQYERSTGKARTFFDKARDRVRKAERVTGPMSETLQAEELGAYAIEEYENAPRSIQMWADDFLGYVKAWALKRFGKQIGRVTPAQLRALAVAALRDTAQPVNTPTRSDRSKRFSIADDSFSTISRANVRDAADAVRGRLTDWTPHMLALIPLNYFTELAQKGQEAIGTYLTVKRQLDAYRGNRHAEADQTVQQWRKYNRLGKDKAAALADVMHQSTIAQYDPSIDNAPGDRAKNAALQKAYDALPDAGKRLYQTVRDSYAAQTKELDGIILDNLKKVFQIAQTKAERKYRKELERISRQQMDPAARKQAQQDAAEVYEATATKAKWSMKARLTKMRQALETSRMEGPYFPLARFGDYFVTVKDITGEVLHFSLHERSAERDKVAAGMRKQFPNGEVVVGIKSNSNELQRAMDPRIIADIQAIIGQSNIDSDIGAQMLDQIWQRYLQSMPDMSVRKRQIHRKNVSGFHADALRAYASHMFHSAHQMGRLKYGVELNELVERASEEAQEASDPTKAGMLANELRERHQWVTNPTAHSLLKRQQARPSCGSSPDHLLPPLSTLLKRR